MLRTEQGAPNLLTPRVNFQANHVELPHLYARPKPTLSQFILCNHIRRCAKSDCGGSRQKVGEERSFENSGEAVRVLSSLCPSV